MLKRVLPAVLLLMLGPVWAAENLISQDTPWRDAPVEEALSRAEKTRVLGISKPKAWVYSPETITIDPAKTYTISMDLRCEDAQALSTQNFIGLVMKDARGRFIVRDSVMAVPGAAGRVAEDAPAGSRKIVADGVVDLSRRSPKVMCLAWNAKEDFSDLPNPDRSGEVGKVEVVDGKTVFTLKTPLPRAVKAGTPFRCHYSRAGFSYGLLLGKLGAEWKTYTCRISGVADRGGADYNKWWPGAKSFQLLLVVNSRPGVKSKVLVKNITVTAE